MKMTNAFELRKEISWSFRGQPEEMEWKCKEETGLSKKLEEAAKIFFPHDAVDMGVCKWKEEEIKREKLQSLGKDKSK